VELLTRRILCFVVACTAPAAAIVGAALAERQPTILESPVDPFRDRYRAAKDSRERELIVLEAVAKAREYLDAGQNLESSFLTVWAGELYRRAGRWREAAAAFQLALTASVGQGDYALRTIPFAQALERCKECGSQLAELVAELHPDHARARLHDELSESTIVDIAVNRIRSVQGADRESLLASLQKAADGNARVAARSLWTLRDATDWIAPPQESLADEFRALSPDARDRWLWGANTFFQARLNDSKQQRQLRTEQLLALWQNPLVQQEPIGLSLLNTLSQYLISLRDHKRNDALFRELAARIPASALLARVMGDSDSGSRELLEDVLGRVVWSGESIEHLDGMHRAISLLEDNFPKSERLPECWRHLAEVEARASEQAVGR
jgi:hypothetical protein